MTNAPVISATNVWKLFGPNPKQYLAQMSAVDPFAEMMLVRKSHVDWSSQIFTRVDLEERKKVTIIHTEYQASEIGYTKRFDTWRREFFVIVYN